jgi:gluconolactonase
MAPPSTVTTPPRDFGPGGAPNVYFTDPDVLTIDPIFNGLRQPNAPIQRLWTGALWSEGPAWSGQGRYLVWSDIPNNRQLRWLEDDGASACSACRRTTATATRSTSRDASSPAST